MSIIDKQSLNVNDIRQAKKKRFQRQTVFLFLMLHNSTASMVTKVTDLPHNLIYSYKQDELYEVVMSYCKLTDIFYLITNLQFTQKSSLLNKY